MDDLMQELETQIRNRPRPEVLASFRRETLAAMAAAGERSRVHWVEWSLAAAALFILWGGLLMMDNQPLSISVQPQLVAFPHKERQAILPELSDGEWNRLSILTRLRTKTAERK